MPAPGAASKGAGVAGVNPVEMIARLRVHAAAASRGNPTENDDGGGGGVYTDEELRSFVSMYVGGEIKDYQMSAWLMAVCFCPLTPRETATLTDAYAGSGRLVAWPDPRRRPPLVDKHSSGGVGDKISLVLAPLVAACGVCVPMMAGRGLGHTGGTIDKLETSFPGYRAEPKSVEDFQRIVLGDCVGSSNAGDGDASSGVGCAIVEAGPELCPADRRIYALRDVTATVSCLPLQTASIMSKKIAERPDSLVLDVKYGDGAFQESVEDARLLAESMVAVGEANGLNPTTAFLTDMNHPIGRAVGNWVEVAECIDVLKGNLDGNETLRLSRDLIALVVVQAGQMLRQSGSYRRSSSSEPGGAPAAGEPHERYRTMGLDECIEHAYGVLDSGRALGTFRAMLLAQGADPDHLERALEDPGAIPPATFVAEWRVGGEAPLVVADVPARATGEVAVLLGAGRKAAGEPVDGQAGIVFHKKTGDSVEPGEVLATVYTNRSREVADAALEKIRGAVALGKAAERKGPRNNHGPIVTHIVTGEGGTEAFAMPAFLLGAGEGSL